jgi:hypothetical protein
MIVLTVIAVALVVIAVRPLLPSVLEGIAPDSALAQTPPAPRFLGISNNNLLLIHWQ